MWYYQLWRWKPPLCILQCCKTAGGKKANGSKTTCKKMQCFCTCCVVSQFPLPRQIKREHVKVSKSESSASCPVFLNKKLYSNMVQGSLGTMLPSMMQNILVSPLKKVLCHNELWQPRPHQAQMVLSLGLCIPHHFVKTRAPADLHNLVRVLSSVAEALGERLRPLFDTCG